MLLRFPMVATIALCLCSTGFAQRPATAPALGYEDSFQIGFFANGAVGGGAGSVFFPFTNAGFHAGPAFPVANSSDICVNAYIIASDGAMASCCACRVPADAFVYIFDAPYSYPGPNVTVKLISTLPARTAPGQPQSQCNARVPPPPSLLGAPLGYATGMRAWTESQSDLSSFFFYEKGLFSPAPLGDTELSRITQQCTLASQCSCLPSVAAAGAISRLSSRPGTKNPFGLK